MQTGKHTKHDHDEEAAGDVEREDQVAERADRLDAVTANGKCHRTESPDRR